MINLVLKGNNMYILIIKHVNHVNINRNVVKIVRTVLLHVMVMLLLDKCEQLMELAENILEYKKRSHVEIPNGPYKIYYHINELAIIGKKSMQGVMDLIGASFNIKRIFNIIREKEIDFNDVYKVMTILTAPSSNFLCNMEMLQK